MDWTEPALFTIAPTGVTVTCSYHWRSGWNTRISRLPGADGRWEHRDYEGLATDELLDVVAAELARVLGLGDP